MRSSTVERLLLLATATLVAASAAAWAAPAAMQGPGAAEAETRQSVEEAAAGAAGAASAGRLAQLAGLAQVAAEWPGAASGRVVTWPVGVPLPPGAEVLGRWPPVGEDDAQWLADDARRRNDKALAYFPLFQPYLGLGYTGNDDDQEVQDPDAAEDPLSRAGSFPLPGTRRQPPADSPVYYIRMPAAPYVFIPGLGYVSQPPAPPPPPPRRAAAYNPFINVPIEFVSNGKPTAVYRWPVATTAKPVLQQSPVNSLDKGPYVFNGKPSRVSLLRDQYNALYADALQSFYP